jgi:hypothetical protein
VFLKPPLIINITIVYFFVSSTETVHNFTKSSPGIGMFFCLKEYTSEDSCDIEASVSFSLSNKSNEMVDLHGFRKLAIF